MKRLYDWRSRLHAVVIDATQKPFEWGTNDCAIFAARCVEAVVGVDYAKDFLGGYTDQTGAAAILRGFGGIDGLVLEMLGADAEIHTSAARRGDIGLIPVDSQLVWAIGVFDHERILVMSASGYGTEDRAKATRAFKVGE